MRCECGAKLVSPTSFCLSCGRVHALACGVYVGDKVYLVAIGKVVETLSFEIYDEEESIRNLFEILAEKIHERRVAEVYVSGEDEFKIKFGFENVKRFALSDLKVYKTQPLPFDEFVSKLRVFVIKKEELRKVDIPPEEKIQGAHTTVIGGRLGREFLYKVALCEYVKKIVPGVITGGGSSLGVGVRFKVTRCDERGNVRALLIDGSSVQEIYIVTTAKNKEQGEIILKMLKSVSSS
ncbi:DUF2103 domain-containing protein [Archaeoglobus sp.]